MSYIDKELIGKTISDVTEGYELVPVTNGKGTVRVMTKRLMFTDGTSAVLTNEWDNCGESNIALRMEKK